MDNSPHAHAGSLLPQRPLEHLASLADECGPMASSTLGDLMHVADQPLPFLKPGTTLRGLVEASQAFLDLHDPADGAPIHYASPLLLSHRYMDLGDNGEAVLEAVHDVYNAVVRAILASQVADRIATGRTRIDGVDERLSWLLFD